MRLLALPLVALAAIVASACSSVQPLDAPGVAMVEDPVFAAYAPPQDPAPDNGTTSPPDTQVVLVEVPPLTGENPTVIPSDYRFELAKGARVVSYEDAWTNLKGEREDLPLLELVGTNPWIIWQHVLALRVNEEVPSASGSATPTTTTSIVQTADDLLSSLEAMHGSGITTKFTGGVAFKTNTFTFQVDDVIDFQKLPHSYLKDLALHIMYFKESSPFYPGVIIHGPIDELRSMVAKLQGKKIITIGWDIQDNAN